MSEVVLEEEVVLQEPASREADTVSEQQIETVESAANACALVQGKPMILPSDLYIPPDALKVFLETFSGPLDLLLYLIRKHNIDILDIPVATITEQYIQYVEMMQEMKLDLAAEYLLMAATLTEIKARLLLPRPAALDQVEEDPRADLVRRLQEYERFKQAAADLDALPRVERDIQICQLELVELEQAKTFLPFSLQELLKSLQKVLQQADMRAHHLIRREPLSVRERMTKILEQVRADVFTDFVALFTVEEGRMGVVVTFIALLELLKQSLIELIQTEAYGRIHVKAVAI
jgi:segregation and condensation protein A